MTNEELIYQYQNGDKKALKTLVENNQGIINKLANKFYTEDTSSIEKADLIQEGYIGLITAADKYNLDYPNRAAFITYATYWVYQKMSRFIKQRSTNDETSLNVPVPAVKDIKVDIIETISAQDNPFERIQKGIYNNPFEAIENRIYNEQLRKELKAVMIDALNLQEREILQLHYGWDCNVMNLTEISYLFKITRSAAAKIENKALGKIRRSKWASNMFKEINGTTSERIKVREIYENEKKISSVSYSGVIEKMSFLQRYFPEVIC